MFENLIHTAQILLPAGADMGAWAVIACDQYTSQPDYWRCVERIAAGKPSALNLMLPEIYLGENDELRIKNINAAMERYEKSVLAPAGECAVFVKRKLRNGAIRLGIVACVDLLDYDYNEGSQSLIRVTEATVSERLPPRVAMRGDSLLEMPHVILLMDDPGNIVFKNLRNREQDFEILYDFDLMQQSGHITGYKLDKKSFDGINEALRELASPQSYKTKYGTDDENVLLFAVGDGNHSLAAAKQCYINLRQSFNEKDWLAHPARYALAEIINLHDQSLEFSAINRMVFGVDEEKLVRLLEAECGLSYDKGRQELEIVQNGVCKKAFFNKTSSAISLGTLQNFLDRHRDSYEEIDYIHGEEVLKQLSKKEGALGFILPVINKNEFFRTIIRDGALPRKTFSVGHAQDKRFYLECRRIK